MLVVATELVKVILTRTLPAGTGGSEDAMALIDRSQLEAEAHRISSSKVKELVVVTTAKCIVPTVEEIIIGGHRAEMRPETRNVNALSRIANRSGMIGMIGTSKMTAVDPIGAIMETIPLLDDLRALGSSLQVDPMPGMNLT